jgi:hypothetical protein
MISIVIEPNEIHHEVGSFSAVKHCQRLLAPGASWTNDIEESNAECSHTHCRRAHNDCPDNLLPDTSRQPRLRL